MHIHILGICGTFMGGIALLAKQKGFTVTGSDQNVYPPMSTQLEAQGITLTEGFDPAQLDPAPDCVVIGNAMSRGNPCVEAVLDQGLNYRSGPQWLAENILQDKWVLAAAGTHGKTSTASMLAWILEYAGLEPGFLIGGVPENFGISARVTQSPFFVVEADEYDTAFFDKRSKFVHYRPRTLILNNLEFDHADIFPDLDAIKTQFHHLVRIVPGTGLIIRPADDDNLQAVLDKGLWTPQETVASEQGWSWQLDSEDGSLVTLSFDGEPQGQLRWQLMGLHNVRNAVAAIAAARHAGVPVSHALAALAQFKNVKRRMELKGEAAGIRVYDDFAHHPTAITTTLQGLRARVGDERIVAVLDPRSNTMKMGVHQDVLLDSLNAADAAVIHMPASFDWQFDDAELSRRGNVTVRDSVDAVLEETLNQVREGDHILVMSNGGFGGIHGKLLAALAAKAT